MDQNSLVTRLAGASQVHLDLFTPSPKVSHLALRPNGFEDGTAFVVSFASTASHIVASLGMEPFAGQLLNGMSAAYKDFARHWDARWRALTEMSASVQAQVGPVSVTSSQLPSQDWTSFSLSAIVPKNSVSTDELKFAFGQSFLDLAFAIIPLEENSDAGHDLGEVEGQRISIEAQRYERSRRNRQVCLDTFGYRCMVCGFDFFEAYGALGSGFAEVHHIEPVSLMAEPRRLKPLEDLVVLCSNCHSMAHRRKPVVPISELVQLRAGSSDEGQ